MGRIRTSSSTRLLRSQEILGRSRECSVVDEDPSVSGVHAVLSWSGTGWVLRDASSLNGTSVNGQSVAPGEAVQVGRGASIRLGHSEPLVLEDDGPPVPHAVQDGGEVRSTQGIGLRFEGEAPVVLLQDGRTGCWWAESPDDRWQVEDGERFEHGGQTWTLHLPRVVAATHRGAGGVPQVSDLAARFEVSPDEEHVRVLLSCGPRSWEPTPRAHHYTVLTLARKRLEDQGLDLPEEEQGWIDRTVLLRQLRITDNLLYTHLHRARTELGELGFPDAADLIQRRMGPGQLRLGIGQLSVLAPGRD